MEAWHIILLVPCILRVGYGLGAPECAPVDTDVADLAEMDIFQTSTLENDGINEEVVQQQMQRVKLPKDFSSYVRGQLSYQARVEAGDESVEFGQMEQDSSSDLAANTSHIELQYYRPVCPYRYYWLTRYMWYFYSGGDTRKYCWSFYPIYVTSCSTRSCNWWFFSPNVWYNFYRCFPEFRYIWVYARCATYQNGKYTWTSEYVRRAVPRACSCRRLFYPLTINRQCPVRSIST